MFEEEATTQMTLEQTRAFYEFLQGGDPPAGITLPDPPQLTAAQASSVLYVLQEGYHLIPDHYERCECCGWLFDTHNAGGYLSDDALHANGVALRDPADKDKAVCNDCWYKAIVPVEEEED